MSRSSSSSSSSGGYGSALASGAEAVGCAVVESVGEPRKEALRPTCYNEFNLNSNIC